MAGTTPLERGDPPDTMKHRDDSSPRTEGRRRVEDRRARPTNPLQTLRSPRRRGTFRREGEARNQYLDHVEPRVVAWSVVVMILCAVDALLTLIHIDAGGEELVPTMRLALSVSNEFFVWSKISVTAIGAAYLAVHQNFFVGKFAMRFVFFVYFFLMLYHAYIVYLRG